MASGVTGRAQFPEVGRTSSLGREGSPSLLTGQTECAPLTKPGAGKSRIILSDVLNHVLPSWPWGQGYFRDRIIPVSFLLSVVSAYSHPRWLVPFCV